MRFCRSRLMTRKFVTAGRIFSITFIPVVLFYLGFFIAYMGHYEKARDGDTALKHCYYDGKLKAIEFVAPKVKDALFAKNEINNSNEGPVDVTRQVTHMLKFGSIVFGSAFGFYFLVFFILLVSAETTIVIFPVAMSFLGITNLAILFQVIQTFILLNSDNFKACAGKIDTVKLKNKEDSKLLLGEQYNFMNRASIFYCSLICIVFCCMGCCAMASLAIADKRPLFMRRIGNQIKGDFDGGQDENYER